MTILNKSSNTTFYRNETGYIDIVTLKSPVVLVCSKSYFNRIKEVELLLRNISTSNALPWIILYIVVPSLATAKYVTPSDCNL